MSSYLHNPDNVAIDNLLKDPHFHFLHDALTLEEMEFQFKQANLSYLPSNNIAVNNAQVVRHKPGRRCLIQYELALKHNNDIKKLLLLGKVRRKGLDKKNFKSMNELWEKGFSYRSLDKISIPQPIGVLSKYNMWLQPVIEGELVTDVLGRIDTQYIAKRVAMSLYKLHNTEISIVKNHGTDAEFGILHNALQNFVDDNPEYMAEIKYLTERANSYLSVINNFEQKIIHRDFYPDQAIYNNQSVTLLDLDLLTKGHPAIDVGNYVAHVMEFGLRFYSDINYYQQHIHAFVDTYNQFTNFSHAEAIRVYTRVSFARHIYLSTKFQDRQTLTKAILEWCLEHF